MPQEDEYISTFKINNPEVDKATDKILKKQQFHHFIKLLEAKQKELSQLCEEKRIDENLTRILREQIVDLLEKIAEFGKELDEYFNQEINFDLKTIDFNIIRKAYPTSWVKDLEIEIPMKKPKDTLYHVSYVSKQEERFKR